MADGFSPRESLLIFLRGLLMGAADIVPGVSGGTMALITGIYERLVDGINGVFEALRPSNLRLLVSREGRGSGKARTVDLQLFVPLLLGIGLAFLTMSHGIDYMIENHEAPTYTFFLGLILASAYFVYRRMMDRLDWSAVAAIMVGFVVGFLVTGLDQLDASHGPVVTFGSGMVAITAMILPGISGSAMLVILNQYDNVIKAIKELDAGTLVAFGAGAVVGILLFSRVLGYLLSNYRNVTFAFLVGLMIGSLRVQYDIIVEEAPDAAGLAVMAACAVAGFAAVLAIERLVPGEAGKEPGVDGDGVAEGEGAKDGK